jgi:hypothetical protein
VASAVEDSWTDQKIVSKKWPRTSS